MSCFTDRPAPPRDVRIKSCRVGAVELSWKPGPDNNSPIIEYVVSRTDSSSDDPTRAIEVTRVTATRQSTLSVAVPARPWTTYTFHVVAVNSIGVSDRASSADDSTPAVCSTPQALPDRNPRGVCSRLVRSTQLVIVWEASFDMQSTNLRIFSLDIGCDGGFCR
jgi:hypothetical protein